MKKISYNLIIIAFLSVLGCDKKENGNEIQKKEYGKYTGFKLRSDSER